MKWIKKIVPLWRNYKCPHCYTIFKVRGVTSEDYECFWCEGVYMEIQSSEKENK